MRFLALVLILLGGAHHARAQAAPASGADSVQRIAAALAVSARLDSARLARDTAVASQILCADVLTIPSAGRPMPRDTMLAWIARGALAYAYAPATEGAVLLLSPDDSTVLLTGRSVRVPADPRASAPARLWVTREFRRRPSGWCQLRSRVRL